jgi:CDP-paratose 2-epimerase
MLEAIAKCEQLVARDMRWSYSDINRIGDHIWWIGDTRRFQSHYPGWSMRYDIDTIMCEIHEGMSARVRHVEPA